nr:hypothetical protein [Cupriavidus pauculus]
MNFVGRALARRGDPALCAEHGPTTIAQCEERFTDRGGQSHSQRCTTIAANATEARECSCV